jgi:hypothetical protein
MWVVPLEGVIRRLGYSKKSGETFSEKGHLVELFQRMGRHELGKMRGRKRANQCKI